ncbi:PEP-CTERM sorting domain-containing protein [Massilia sp. IC2-476]|uniref:PEP-CTERM sorting domain-containing protein n=1 Tax=Massilia sp. IC2-476 TaxID=2887199 RepID=UPI001D10DB59|nr:PEP-CTERM sorting domain-containing protein [Massilia sp. IC2-476]MCC2973547.1 PEP-CTERM sorting domain-containing protein [Massilia sp. IC2-476]
MKTLLAKATAILALTAGVIASSQAGTLTYQGVTFTSTWSGNLLTLEIDAAKRSGDWLDATSIGALQLKDLGSFSDVTLVSAPGAATDWTLSSNELNANGCSGGAHAGRSLCFSGERVLLSDDMVFQFSFSGGAPALDAPHLKVNFFGEGERKVGSLLSQAIAPVPEPQTYAMMLGGLGLMGFMARRKRRQP